MLGLGRNRSPLLRVMAGLVPAIWIGKGTASPTGMAGTSPAMTIQNVTRLYENAACLIPGLVLRPPRDCIFGARPHLGRSETGGDRFVARCAGIRSDADRGAVIGGAENDRFMGSDGGE